MFGIGTTEILLILVVALLVIGPTKLPEVARALGKGMAEFRKMSSDVKRTIDLEGQLSDMEDSPSEEDGRTGGMAADEVPKGKESKSDESKQDKDQSLAKEGQSQEGSAHGDQEQADKVESDQSKRTEA